LVNLELMIAFLRNQLQVATKNQTAQNNQNLFFMPNTSIFHYDYYHQPTNFIPSDSSIPQPNPTNIQQKMQFHPL